MLLPVHVSAQTEASNVYSGQEVADASSSSAYDMSEYEVYFRFDRTDIDLDYLNNKANLASLRHYLGISHRIDSITIYSYASPEGSEEHNRWLSEQRAISAKQFLLSHSPDSSILNAGMIRICPLSENWPGLIRLVEERYFRDDRERVLRILYNKSITNDTRKWRLGRLDQGYTWRYLKRMYMPELRVSTWVSVHGDIAKPFSLEQAPSSLLPKPSQYMIISSLALAKALKEGASARNERVASQNAGAVSQNAGAAARQDGTAARQESTSECQESAVSRQSGTSACQEGAAAKQESTSECQESAVSRQESNTECQDGTAARQESTSTCQEGAAAKHAAADSVQTAGKKRQGLQKWTKEQLDSSQRTILAFKTNLLLDAVTALNYSVEVPVNEHFSLQYFQTTPWWNNRKNNFCLQFLSFGGEARWWFLPRTRAARSDLKQRDALVGHFLGAYGWGGNGDLQLGRNICQQFDFWSAGLTYGYAMPVGKYLNMEFTLSVGYAAINYQHYVPTDDFSLLVRDPDLAGKLHYIGPTKAEISLVIPIRAKTNKKGGTR